LENKVTRRGVNEIRYFRQIKQVNILSSCVETAIGAAAIGVAATIGAGARGAGASEKSGLSNHAH
jgi:hypothetical protein